MAAYNFSGYVVDPGKRDANPLIRGGNDPNKVVLRQDYTVAANLPVVALNSVNEPVVIPKGKILTVDPAPLTDGPAVIRVCNATAIPAGMAQTDYYKQSTYTMQRAVPAPIKDQQVTIPYVQAVNGNLTNGMFVKSDANGNVVQWVNGTDSPELIVGRVDIVDCRAGKAPGWLKWVEANFMGLYIPMFANVATAVVLNDGSDNAATVAGATISRDGVEITLVDSPAASLQSSGDGVFYLTHERVNLNARALDVYVDGVLQPKLTEEAYNGDGLNYSLDPVKGTITFSEAPATTEVVTASYAYEIGDVPAMGQGIPGLTDGAVSGLGAGTPAWMDQVGSTGYLRLSLRTF